MNKKKWILMPLLISLLIVLILNIDAILKGNVPNPKDVLIVFAIILFTIYVLIGVFESYKSIFYDFLQADSKGKLLIVIIFVSFILKAIYEIRLSR